MVKLNVSRQQVSAKDSVSAVQTYAGYGYPVANEQWRLGVSGFVWQSPIVYNRRKRMMIRMLGNVMQATPQDLECETFQTRISPFMADADHRKRIEVTLGNQTFALKKKPRRNGHFRDWLMVSDSLIRQHAQADANGNRFLTYSVRCDDPSSLSSEGKMMLLPAKGISVISDIDDTIKISAVGDRRELLHNTFLRKFSGVDGMAQLYQRWAKANASFHYVSSSPWQLYQPLQGMYDDLQFPVGTMHLRNFRLRDQLLKRVRFRRHGKSTAIRSLLRTLPQREFVLIGDSGEKDPEIYRKICRAFPGRIRGLFIRQLDHRPLTPERLKKLQSALPDRPSGIFSSGSELAELTQDLLECKVSK